MDINEKGRKKVYTINNSHMKDEDIVTWTKITTVIAVLLYGELLLVAF